MSKPRKELTKQQYEVFKKAVIARMSEMGDGFVVLGFHPITGQPFEVWDVPDEKTRLALMTLVEMAKDDDGGDDEES